MPADSLDGRLSTFSGPGVRGCRFRVLRWYPCLAARLARVIATTTCHRSSRCAHNSARAGVPILGREITICDREAHAHGLHTRTAHRQMSIKSAVRRVQCAECSTGRACASRTNAPPLSRRVVWLPANMVVRWQLETRIKVQPLCHTADPTITLI